MKLREKDFCYTLCNQNMYVDGDDLWFVSVDGSVLCKGSRSSNRCECVARVPLTGEEGGLIPYPVCVKDKDMVVLFPGLGKKVWLYDLKHKTLREMIVENPKDIQLNILDFEIINRTLWAWSGRFSGLRCLIEIDLDHYEVKDYHQIVGIDLPSTAWQPTRSGDYIYFYENSRKQLYEFDTVSKSIQTYKLNGITSVIVTICCDEDVIWLAGEEKCIYIWNKNDEKLEQYTEFPEDFLIVSTEEDEVENARWSFCYSVCLNEYVCFVPRNVPGTMCNGVLFVNKRDHTMRMMKLYDETKKGTGVYKLEYVIDGRYIGIHYWPNGFISEIDTSDFTVKEKRLRFSYDSYTKL